LDQAPNPADDIQSNSAGWMSC